MKDTERHPCLPHPESRERCRSYRPGHHMHAIHARRVGETPWGWRDAVVVAVAGTEAELAYVSEDAHPRLWHHRSLAAVLSVGDLVRLHEGYYALGTPHGWFSVVVTDGLGAVTAPDDTDLWAPEIVPGIVDLATGVAIPMDHRGSVRH